MTDATRTHSEPILEIKTAACVGRWSWVVAYLVPVVGPMLGVMLFALVLAVLVGLLFSWVGGMVYALQAITPRCLRGPPGRTPVLPAIAICSPCPKSTRYCDEC